MNEGNIELASKPRSRDFPDRWGIPPGRPYSAERRNWIKLNIARDETDPEVRRQRCSRALDAYAEALKETVAEMRG